MKLFSKLLPLALFFALPLAGCNFGILPEGGNTPGTNGNSQGEDPDETPLTLQQVISKVESTFNVTLEYDSGEDCYYVSTDTTSNARTAVSNAMNKVDFLDVYQELTQATEDEDGFDGYYALFDNSDESVELNICSYEYDGDKYLDYCVYELGSGSQGGGGEAADLDEILKEISYNVLGEDDGFEYDSEYDEYWMEVEWGTSSSYSLVEAVDEASEYLPDVFVWCDYESAEEDEWDDGDAGAFNSFYDEDYTVECDIGSYIYGSTVIVMFEVYSLDY